MANRLKAFVLGLTLAAAGVAVAQQVFPWFAPATGILVGNENDYHTTAATSANVVATFSGTCNSSTFLRGDGQCAAGGGGGGSPGGADGDVQFNDDGAFGGATGLRYDVDASAFSFASSGGVLLFEGITATGSDSGGALEILGGEGGPTSGNGGAVALTGGTGGAGGNGGTISISAGEAGMGGVDGTVSITGDIQHSGNVSGSTLIATKISLAEVSGVLSPTEVDDGGLFVAANGSAQAGTYWYTTEELAGDYNLWSMKISDTNGSQIFFCSYNTATPSSPVVNGCPWGLFSGDGGMTPGLDGVSHMEIYDPTKFFGNVAFGGQTPADPPDYTCASFTPDRSLTGGSPATTDELCTVISDLIAIGLFQ